MSRFFYFLILMSISTLCNAEIRVADKYTTSIGWTVQKQDTIYLGTGSRDDSSFQFVGKRKHANKNFKATYGIVIAIEKEVIEHEVVRNAWIYLKIDGETYSCNIEQAIRVKEVILPDRFKNARIMPFNGKTTIAGISKEYDQIYKGWRIQTSPIRLSEGWNVTATKGYFRSMKNTILFGFSSTYFAVGVVGTHDPMTFLFENDSTTEIFPKEIQSTSLNSGYSNEYIISAAQVEMIARNQVKQVRRIYNSNYADLSIPAQYAKALSGMAKIFMDAYKEDSALPEEVETINVSQSSSSLVDELIKLKKLKDDGVITEEEFTKGKQKILDK